MSLTIRSGALACLTTLSSTAFAQQRYYVADRGHETIWRVEDLTLDGDFNDAGEVVAFYDAALGPVAMPNVQSMHTGPNGVVFASDVNNDQILRFADLNHDGDALDAGEATIFFDSATNASGITLSSGLNFCVTPSGVLYIANSGNGASPADTIVRLEDLSANDDAQDAGEASVYYLLPSGANGAYLPTAVLFGPDGALYYIETGNLQPKAVWRLVDTDSSGSIDQPGEAAVFFTPAAQPAAGFHWMLRLDANGNFYMDDTGNRLFWKFADANGDHFVDPVTEAAIFWQNATASQPYDLVFAPDGTYYATDTAAPDRLWHFVDVDSNGLIGPGEATEVYSDLLGATDIGDPRSIELVGPEINGSAFCFGDGLDPAVTTPCPCGNFGAPGHGCGHSFNANGGLLEANGSSIADTVVLHATELPASSFTLFIQHATATQSTFHDGVICAGNPLVRLRGRSAVAGEAFFPNSNFAQDNTTTLSIRGGVTLGSGATRYYAAWYRNASTTFCPPATANVSNGFSIVW